jgi:hypothetical protein
MVEHRRPLVRRKPLNRPYRGLLQETQGMANSRNIILP